MLAGLLTGADPVAAAAARRAFQEEQETERIDD
jgi:hypothetical protein